MPSRDTRFSRRWRRGRPWWTGLIAVLVVAAGVCVGEYQRAHRASTSANAPVISEPTPQLRGTAPPAPGDLAAAIRSHRSGVEVESEGIVVKVLPDDTQGDRHQRFLVRIAGGHTVLIAHNIDLAERAPVTEGQTVGFKGEFEFNDRGGLVHWTHRDRRQRHPDGWVGLNGRRYD